jgi:hypothetical protein
MAINQIDEELKLIALLERTNLSSVTEFEKTLVKTLEKILGKLAGFPTEFSRNRYQALLKEIQQLILSDYPKLYDLIRKDQELWAKISYEANATSLLTTLAPGTVVATSFAKLPESAVKRILDPQMLIQDQTLKEAVQNMANVNAKRIRSVLATGLTTGAPTADINREIKEIYGNIARNQVDALSRTAIATATDEANTEAAFQIDKTTNVINTAYYSATIDSRTTPFCSFAGGLTWYRKEGESLAVFKQRVLAPSSKTQGRSPRTPNHWNCRSRLLFTTREFVKEFESGEKVATVQDISHDRKNVTKHRDGSESRKFRVQDRQTIKAKTDYSTWFNRQNADFQQNYLGKTKYSIYKSNNLSVEELWNVKQNRILTIEEIQAKGFGIAKSV